MRQLETVLQEIGTFGRYQKLRFYLLCIPAGIICCFGFSVFIFMSYVPTHYCRVPQLNHTAYGFLRQENVSREDWLNLTIPRENGDEYSKCMQYDFQAMHHQSIDHFNGSKPTVACQAGWEFGDEFGETIITRWSLVCDRDWYRHLIMSVTSFMAEFGLLVFSYLQDRFGRKKTFFAALTWYIIWGLVSCVAPSPETFMITWSFRTMVAAPMFQIPYILALEIVGIDERTFVNCAMSVLFALAQPLLAYLCWQFKSYVQQVLVTTVPAVLLYALWFVVDESPRWLLTVGRDDEAKEILHKMARINGTVLREDTWEQLLAAAEEEHIPVVHKGSTASANVQTKRPTSKAAAFGNYVLSNSFFVLFSRCSLAVKTLCITYIWLVCYIVFYGLGLNVENLRADRYILFAVLGLAEIPSLGFNWLMLDRVGRIWPMGAATTIAGVSSILTAVVPQTDIWLIVLFAIITKLSITSAFLIIYQVAGEMYPTSIRATGVGFTSLVSGTIATATPFIIYAAMATNLTMLPMIIFGILTIVGGLVTFALPETAHQPLPDTVEESERMFGIGWRTTANHLRCKHAKYVRRRKRNNFMANGDGGVALT